MQYGSEFRPTAILDKIFHSHRYWKRVRTNLEKGVHYNVKKLTKKKREENLRRALAYGNHKSAKDRPEACLELMEKDADLGYSACFPLEHTKNIVNGELYPVGIQLQNSINREGEIYVKMRLTHDLSFPKRDTHSRKRKTEEISLPLPPGYPVKKQKGPNLNSRCDMTGLIDCMYGQAIRRTCHIVQKLRILNPRANMLATKTDLDKAYRRKHTSGNSAARSMAVVGDILHVLFRLPFGASPAPPEWCPIMEMIVDLANRLVQCKDWNPKTLNSPWHKYFPHIDFKAEINDPPVAYELDVDVPITSEALAGAEGYVDDGIGICAGDKILMERMYAAIPLATHIMSRPVAIDEPIERPEPLNELKCEGEGKMEDEKNSWDGFSCSMFTPSVCLKTK